MMKRQHITVIPGDGIGPGLITAALKVLDKLGCEFEYDYAEIGQAALDAGKDLLPEEVLDLIRKNKIAIKGPITTPIGEGFSSVNVSLRRHFNLYANFRPVVSYPGSRSAYENVDIISDLCAGLVGGLGMAPGANIGDRVAIFEAVHGSAPDIADKNIANPISLFLASALMLDHLNLGHRAKSLRDAIRDALQKRDRVTADLGGEGSTAEFTDAILERL